MGIGFLFTSRAWAGTLSLSIAMAPALASAGPVTVSHAKGELTLDAVPKKIAVFDLASLDTLAALGVSGVVAGVPKSETGEFNAPAYLSAYGDAAIAGVGTLFEPNLDALKALEPDLIIIAGRSAGKYDAVKAIAPTLDLSSTEPSFLKQATERAELLGRIFEREDEAAAKVESLTKAVADMQAAAPKDEKGVVVFAVNDNYMLHAPGARFGGLLDLAGLPSIMEPFVAPAVDAPRAERPAPGSPEAEAAQKKRVEARDAELAKQPEWLITLDRGAISAEGPSDIAERMAKIETFAATPAWQKGQVIHLDPKAWYLVGSGLQNMQMTAEQIKAAYEKR